MLEPSVFHQYILSDFTPEVLVHQHRANPRGLIVFNDELMGFILSFNKYRSGFVDRWLFAFPEKVRYPKFNDVDIDEKIARNWKEIVDRILELPFDDTPRVVKLSAGAKAIFKEWFDKLAEQKNNGGTRFAGLATKMDRYCGRMALGIEIMKYGCKESELLDISEDSMRCSIAVGTLGTLPLILTSRVPRMPRVPLWRRNNTEGIMIIFIERTTNTTCYERN